MSEIIHAGMGSDLMSLCGVMKGISGHDQVKLSYVDDQVTCLDCLKLRIKKFKNQKVFEVYDGHAGYTYYAVGLSEEDAITTVFNHIGPAERRRMLDFHEKIIADLKAFGKGEEFPDKLTDEDYLKELEVTGDFAIQKGLVLEPKI